MPEPQSFSELLFVAVSCSDQTDEGAWRHLGRFIQHAQPHFLLMLGDQIYMDEAPDVWSQYLSVEPTLRRTAMTEKYQETFSRPYVSGNPLAYPDLYDVGRPRHP
jgi:phosphodiesterase/alkaline phosphatase D-like protein